MPLSLLLLSWLMPAWSLWWLGVLFFLILHSFTHPEAAFPLRLTAGATSKSNDGPVQEHFIIVRTDHQIEFDNDVCDHPRSKALPQLQTRIREHFSRSPSSRIIVAIEPQAKFERLIDVLNAFEACNEYRYRLQFLPALMGPPAPD